MSQRAHRVAIRPFVLIAALALITGCAREGRSPSTSGEISTPTSPPFHTPSPPPAVTPTPPEAPEPEQTPVVPSTGGTYRVTVEFVRATGACGGPSSFQDLLMIEINERLLDEQEISILQPSTGDANGGTVQQDGAFEARSERESYAGQFGFERDSAGSPVRITLTARNTYQDAQGCTTEYDVEGEGAIEGQ